jgi:hypothetical protein
MGVKIDLLALRPVDLRVFVDALTRFPQDDRAT